MSKAPIGDRLPALSLGIVGGLFLVAFGYFCRRRGGLGSRQPGFPPVRQLRLLGRFPLEWLGWSIIAVGLVLVLEVLLILTGLAAGVK